jgi:LysM repeat protein
MQPRGVRLTRRGRVVVILFLLAVAAVGLAFTAPASDAAAPSGPRAVVVVRPGDSLWSIAARYLPSHDAPGTVEEIRRLNGLDGYTIYAGQQLTLPKHR